MGLLVLLGLILHSAPARAQELATITAYCLSGTMRSGRGVYAGAVAADLSVFPLGTRLLIDGLGGEYTVEDTGLIYGSHIDVWMPSCGDAIIWGRQTREIEVLR